MKLTTIINLPRGGGKTTALVYASAINGVPILCLNKDNKKHIEDLANKLGLEIPEPLTCCSTDIQKQLGSLGVTKILIDNAEATIPVLINELAGVQVCGMTMSVPMNYPTKVNTTKTETFEETAERLMETIKMRSFDEAAKDAANHLAKTLKDFGFSVN